MLENIRAGNANRIIKFWRRNCKVNICNIENNFSFCGNELDCSSVNSNEIKLLSDDGLRDYKNNLIIISNDVKNKFKLYQSYFLFNAYNPDYEKIKSRLTHLFCKFDQEIKNRKRSLF